MGFPIKKPKANPRNVDFAAQKRFIREYREFVKNTLEDEPVLFMEVVHPMNTKASCDWIRTGTEKLIKTSGSRIGTINLFWIKAGIILAKKR